MYILVLPAFFQIRSCSNLRLTVCAVILQGMKSDPFIQTVFIYIPCYSNDSNAISTFFFLAHVHRDISVQYVVFDSAHSGHLCHSLLNT